ncbi:hypothetical protein FGO68_gene4097 [Halteria grandinella]|uniref:Uncharacterized protein n=1 Tax=Halteria grandinella TaxID=5974 RepID=A0A8J8NR13_HALGN|nr:hypothetical protein FGO68_gene4097 [Halteria grandinella]
MQNALTPHTPEHPYPTSTSLRKPSPSLFDTPTQSSTVLALPLKQYPLNNVVVLYPTSAHSSFLTSRQPQVLRHSKSSPYCMQRSSISTRTWEQWFGLFGRPTEQWVGILSSNTWPWLQMIIPRLIRRPDSKKVISPRGRQQSLNLQQVETKAMKEVTKLIQPPARPVTYKISCKSTVSKIVFFPTILQRPLFLTRTPVQMSQGLKLKSAKPLRQMNIYRKVAELKLLAYIYHREIIAGALFYWFYPAILMYPEVYRTQIKPYDDEMKRLRDKGYFDVSNRI